MKRLLSHVDLRVRDRTRAIAFYDSILGALGYANTQSKRWVCYERTEDEGSEPLEWFAFTVDPAMTAGLTRIAFAAETCEEVDRVTRVAMDVGAANIEGPDYDYGPQYYAVFFEDPDGNKLEVCCNGPRAQAAG